MASSGPMVSVIVPVYNAGAGLIHSIESLLSQSLKNIEIIIVNDASTDNSGVVIDQLAQAYSNIVPVHFEENKGVHEARLAGIKRSSAPWIGFLDADDFARGNMFQVMLDAGKKHGVDIVVCGSYRVTPDRRLIAPKLRFKRSRLVASDVFEKFCRFEFGTGVLWNKLYRREIISPFKDLHFPWRQNINEDLILNIGFFNRAKTVYLSDAILHEYVLNEASVTSNARCPEAFASTLKAFSLALGCLPDLTIEDRMKVLELYRRQLSWQNYYVKDVRDLMVHEGDLKEAVNILNKVGPIYLVLLSARKIPEDMSFKLLLHLVYIKVKGLFSKFLY